MKGPQHFCIGFVTGGSGLWGLSLLGAPLGPAAIGVGAIAAGLGSLAPDIDHPRSLIANRIPGKAAKAALSLALPLTAVAAFAWYFAGRRAGPSLVGTFAPVLYGALAVVVVAVVLGIVSLVVSKTLGHRGPVHSIAVGAVAAAGVAAGCAALGWPVWYSLAFGWGWLTHLAADMTTRNGLHSVLWPLRAK